MEKTTAQNKPIKDSYIEHILSWTENESRFEVNVREIGFDDATEMQDEQVEEINLEYVSNSN